MKENQNASVERLVHALDRVYQRPWLLMWRSFLSGMMAAIGAVIGTALIGALSVYFIHIFGGFTWLQTAAKNIENSAVQEALKNR